MTRLVRPTMDLWESWAECYAEFDDPHPPASALWLVEHPGADRATCEQIVAIAEKYADYAQELPDQYVHGDMLWVTESPDGVTDTVIGFCWIRHTLNAHLLEAGGHVGYAIRPSRRRVGHATRTLGLALDRLADRGVERVLVVCEDDNVASARVIEHHGGVMEDIREGKRRYWIDC